MIRLELKLCRVGPRKKRESSKFRLNARDFFYSDEGSTEKRKQKRKWHDWTVSIYQRPQQQQQQLSMESSSQNSFFLFVVVVVVAVAAGEFSEPSKKSINKQFSTHEWSLRYSFDAIISFLFYLIFVCLPLALPPLAPASTPIPHSSYFKCHRLALIDDSSTEFNARNVENVKCVVTQAAGQEKPFLCSAEFGNFLVHEPNECNEPMDLYRSTSSSSDRTEIEFSASTQPSTKRPIGPNKTFSSARIVSCPKLGMLTESFPTIWFRAFLFMAIHPFRTSCVTYSWH